MGADLQPGYVGRLFRRVGGVDLADDSELWADLEERLRSGSGDRCVEDVMANERGRIADGSAGTLLQLGARALEELRGGEREGGKLCSESDVGMGSGSSQSTIAKYASVSKSDRRENPSSRTFSDLPAQ